jgi:hypothetical protein
MSKINENPHVYAVNSNKLNYSYDDQEIEEIDREEVFELIRHINDPEHPLSLEQLNVAQLDLISVKNKDNLN